MIYECMITIRTFHSLSLFTLYGGDRQMVESLMIPFLTKLCNWSMESEPVFGHIRMSMSMSMYL